MKVSEIKTAGEIISRFKRNSRFKNTIFKIENIWIESLNSAIVYLHKSELHEKEILFSVICKNKQQGKEMIRNILIESLPEYFEFEYDNPLRYLPKTTDVNSLVYQAYREAFNILTID